MFIILEHFVGSRQLKYPTRSFFAIETINFTAGGSILGIWRFQSDWPKVKTRFIKYFQFEVIQFWSNDCKIFKSDWQNLIDEFDSYQIWLKVYILKNSSFIAGTCFFFKFTQHIIIIFKYENNLHIEKVFRAHTNRKIKQTLPYITKRYRLRTFSAWCQVKRHFLWCKL